MGDPRHPRKKYSTPQHPWQKERLDEERAIKRAFGTSNKKEIWKMNSKIRRILELSKQFRNIASPQQQKESELYVTRLKKYGLLNADATVGAALDIQPEEVFNRRLQSILVKKDFARTMRQARQFITHGHIVVGDRKITSPSYLVSLQEEQVVEFHNKSQFKDPEHPERAREEKPEEVELKAKETEKKTAAKKEEKKEEVKKEEKKEKKAKPKKAKEAKEEKKEAKEETKEVKEEVKEPKEAAEAAKEA